MPHRKKVVCKGKNGRPWKTAVYKNHDNANVLNVLHLMNPLSRSVSCKIKSNDSYKRYLFFMLLKNRTKIENACSKDLIMRKFQVLQSSEEEQNIPFAVSSPENRFSHLTRFFL